MLLWRNYETIWHSFFELLTNSRHAISSTILFKGPFYSFQEFVQGLGPLDWAGPSKMLTFLKFLLNLVPHSTDTQSLARATPYCARSTLDIVVQVRQSIVCAPVRSIIPELKLGDYLSVQAHKPCSISHLNLHYKNIHRFYSKMTGTSCQSISRYFCTGTGIRHAVAKNIIVFFFLFFSFFFFLFFLCHTAIQSYKGIFEYCRLT